MASEAEFRNSQVATALQCLVGVAARHGIDLSVEGICHRYALGPDPISQIQLLRIAKDAGLRARVARLDWDALLSLDGAYPALFRLANGNWVVVAGAATDADGQPVVRVLDPLAERLEPLEIGREKFCAAWDGDVILVKKARRLPGQPPPFGLRWFLSELIREKRLFADVAVAAVVLYCLGFALPIFFQLVIDKVLVHESFTTLYVLAAGVSIALAFDATFTFLRRYLLIYATNKIDIRVSTKTFAHLVGLPISFFEHISAGVLVKHMQQSARVREFLTGRLFLTALDALSLLVIVPVLALYSVNLTFIVLGFTGLIALAIAVLVGPFRQRLLSLYQAEGERQALLVETVHGMQTIKALAMEPLQSRQWSDRSAESVSTRFGVERISAVAQSVTGLLDKLTSLTVIGFGAMYVFDGTMTVGALVAFNMLSGRVSGPLTQMVTMIHEYQEVALAMRMLGEVMNQKREREGRREGLRPDLKGQIEFENVSFRYGADGPPALDDVSFTIPAGGIFGVVGRSGSGKTTLTRLISGLYPIQQGLVRIDGVDARELDLVHLRKSIGVVLQENFLFRGTVRDNIGCVNPDASFDAVAQAAQLAGADEFIERLPRGFDTMLEENAQNLSGGQKQRLAIARALVSDPRLLILDEATSALDSESEAIVRRNLRRIAEGRTVIIVSHRLSMLADADVILVVDRGRIADLGAHDELLTRCPRYRQLWNQQVRQVA